MLDSKSFQQKLNLMMNLIGRKIMELDRVICKDGLSLLSLLISADGQPGQVRFL